MKYRKALAVQFELHTLESVGAKFVGAGWYITHPQYWPAQKEHRATIAGIGSLVTGFPFLSACASQVSKCEGTRFDRGVSN